VSSTPAEVPACAGCPVYLGGVRPVPAVSGTLVPVPPEVSSPLRRCMSVPGSVLGASPWVLSSRSPLVAGGLRAPGCSGPRMEGLVVLGVPGLPGPVPGLPGPVPMLLLPPILPAAPVSPLPPVPPTWAKARVHVRQSTGSDAANDFANFQNIGCLPSSKCIIFSCSLHAVAHGPVAARLSRGQSKSYARSDSDRLKNAVRLITSGQGCQSLVYSLHLSWLQQAYGSQCMRQMAASCMRKITHTDKEHDLWCGGSQKP
jgi:hypothetical protein